MSAVAQIAAAQGYEVSGCDLNLDSPYLSHLKNRFPQIKTYNSHSSDHLQNIDLLCVTPAIFYQNDNHPEIEAARLQNKLSTWQEFMGNYLHKNKYVIAVAGTHGKSTTTALAGLLLEKANLDPTVEVGATLKDWHNNVRIGKSRYFISEADEFHDNFASYHPDIIILTLLEFDHPEYFGNLNNMLACFQRFIDRLKPNGSVIYNADSPLTSRLNFPKNSHPYHLTDFPSDLNLSQPGDHNRLNSLCILMLAHLLEIPAPTAYSVLSSFAGLERRLDLLGETSQGTKIYDDYANHPSSYSATISTLKNLYPDKKLYVVIEPHTFSRLRALLSELPQALEKADELIVSKIFASREADPGDFTGQNIINAAKHPNAKYIPEFSDIVTHFKNASPGKSDLVLVMGSGNSYKLSRQLLTIL